jgi:hypothetical protein
MTSARRKLTARPLTEIDLLAWLSQAQAGDTLEYHRGFLALDRWHQSSALSEGDRQALCRLANLAMRLSVRGLIDLVQRRICPDCFSYLVFARQRLNSTLLSFLDAERQP